MAKKLEQKIMGQVKRVYYLKKVFNPLIFKVYVLALATTLISSLVSISNVFNNMPSLLEFNSIYRFTNSAILNTELSVQLVLGVVVVVVALFIRDTVKNFSHSAELVRN